MTITSLNIAEGTVGHRRRCMPKCRTVKIIIVVIIVLLCVAALLAYFLGAFIKKKEEEVLNPPNPTKPLPYSPSVLHTFQKAAVCADGPPCAEIGRGILERNGTAVDSAIAALFCNGLLNMQSMGLGGGFFMTIYIRGTTTAYTLDAREEAPSKATPDMFGDDANKAKFSGLSIGVPGELRGYWAAHKRFGKLPWKELIQPSIDLCETGFNMSLAMHDGFSYNPEIHKDANIKEWFMHPNGTLKSIGSLIKPQRLCNTLKIIAENGGDDLYNGTLAKLFLEDVQEFGGIITAEDLNNYTARWEEPIHVSLQNSDNLYSMPLPGSGILLGFMLNILNGYNFTKDSTDGLSNTVLTYHRIIEAFKYSYARRTELGDPKFVNMTELTDTISMGRSVVISQGHSYQIILSQLPKAGCLLTTLGLVARGVTLRQLLEAQCAYLTSPEYANEIRLKIRDNTTSNDPKYYGAVSYNQEDHGTAHISVLAENGDAVSVTSTVNIFFGAGTTSKQTGILFNNGMDDFASPKFKSFFGIPYSPNNAIAPGKRALSSMSPSIITDKNGEVRLVIGASGGTKITTSIALVIMRNLWFGQNIKEAVDAPRIHHQIYPMEIAYEYGNLQQVISGLEALGHKTKRYTDRGSIICALLKRMGVIFANADYRKGGDVYGIN